jgi:nucleotide-binding universal stress UspA family protein
MAFIEKILFPVDFSPASVAAVPFVRRFASILSAQVTLLHVVKPFDYSSFELYVRPFPEVEADHRSLVQEHLNSFLELQFPARHHPRLLESGDVARKIAEVAREQKCDLIVMPTYSGRLFRRMLLGSTTAKALNDADCPALTPPHSDTIAPRPIEHREIACAIRLDADGRRVLRYGGQLAEPVHSQLSIIHVIPGHDPDVPVLFDEGQPERSVEVAEAQRHIDELQRLTATHAQVLIAVGGIKRAIIESTQRLQTDVLVIGRSSESGVMGRLRDLSYALVRDSLCPVISV